MTENSVRMTIFTDASKRYVHAPYQQLVTTSAVQGVWLSKNEDAEWIYSFDGKYIIGYNIIARTDYYLHAR